MEQCQYKNIIHLSQNNEGKVSMNCCRLGVNHCKIMIIDGVLGTVLERQALSVLPFSEIKKCMSITNL